MKYTLIQKHIKDSDLKTDIACATLVDEFGKVIKTYQFPIIGQIDDLTNAISGYFDVICTICKNDDKIFTDALNRISNVLDSLLEELNVELVDK